MKYVVYGISRSGHNFIKDNIESWTGAYPRDVENPMGPGLSGSFNIICVRDYLNNLASLCKSKPSFIDKSINSWGFLAKEAFNESFLIKNRIPLIYDKFRKDKDYRIKICKLIEGNYNEDKLNTIPKNGMISHFPMGQEVQSDPEKMKEFLQKYKNKANKLKVHERWKQIQETDKEYFLKKIKQNTQNVELYLKHFEVEEEKIEFLEENNII